MDRWIDYQAGWTDGQMSSSLSSPGFLLPMVSVSQTETEKGREHRGEQGLKGGLLSLGHNSSPSFFPTSPPNAGARVCWGPEP